MWPRDFSGHGLMQSPAVGKGLSELIRNGCYGSVDLSPLSVERIFTSELYKLLVGHDTIHPKTEMGSGLALTPVFLY